MNVMNPDNGVASPVHVWRHLTGGGRPVDYLNWLAAKYEQYLHENYLLEDLIDESVREATPQLSSQQFLVWLTVQQRTVFGG